MLIDRETGFAVAASGAYERIMRSGTETEEFGLDGPGSVGPTLWVTYVGGEIAYRGSNPMHAIAVAQEHRDVETVIDEVPISWFEESWPANQPIMGQQPLDDALRASIAPLVLDSLLGYADLTDGCGAPLGETLETHEGVWYNAMDGAQQADIDEMIELAYGYMDEVGCLA